MSVPFTSHDVRSWTGATHCSGPADARFDGVAIDTRAVVPGQLFIAIRGPRHDAHDFLADAARSGARGLLVETGRADAAPEGVCVLAVPDTTIALGKLASGHRDGFQGPLIAVTGSNGKTTTKEMIAAILGVDAPCLKNEGNLNNEFGLPLTLLRREEGHQAAVVELGMNHRGEIARLVAIAKPDVGVITNVGTAHIEHLGSREEIALEKGDLVAGLDPKATAVLNADDPRVLAQRSRAPGAVVTFGLASDADVRAEGVRAEPDGGFRFGLVAPEGRVELAIEGLADTTVPNALAAAAAARAAGFDLDAIRRGLASYRGISGRMERLRLEPGITVIHDAYNANPQSMRAALESLARLRAQHRGIAVLGDMGELGPRSEEAHREAGRRVAELGLDLLFLLGECAAQVADGATAAGMQAASVHRADDHAGLAALLREELHPGDWVLVKGSRAMRMEQVIEALRTESPRPEAP